MEMKEISKQLRENISNLVENYKSTNLSIMCLGDLTVEQSKEIQEIIHRKTDEILSELIEKNYL